MSDTQRKHNTPIAVVGVSALFPGSVDVTGFWNDILAGHDLMSDVPADHWLVEDYFDPHPESGDKIYATRGAFLKSVDFDPLEWGMPPANLAATDTAQLLALMVAQKVLEDAAQDRKFENMDRDGISVILGVASATELVGQMSSRIQRPVWENALRASGLPESQVQTVADRIAGSYAEWKEATFPGLLGNVVAGRIANRLNLGGTNCVIDAACASSLAAVAMGIQELQLGHSDLVISGGVDALNDPFMYMCFSKTPALSATGDCRPFSEDADGTMLGEGLGMLALKRLGDAERDGDRIYAVLRGLGSSSDGKSKSVYAPVSQGQAKALRRAYEAAGYDPGTVEIVEAHGTATKAGDAAEFGGLCEVFGASAREDRQWCALGSVKSQIGHTKAAAGSASLIKMVMALHHKVLPPTIKVSRPNPALEIEKSPFYLNTRTRPWIRDDSHPRRASVSSFGFGGSNFHVALEEYTGAAPRPPRLRSGETELFLFSAANADGLRAKVEALCALARTWASDDRPAFWFHAHRSLSEFDPGAAARLGIVASDVADLLTKGASAIKNITAAPDTALHLPIGIYYRSGVMAGVLDGADDTASGTEDPRDRCAFLFPGQGSQYVNMGADLAWRFDEARAVWDSVASMHGTPLADLPLSVFPRPEFDDAANGRLQVELTETERAQPAIGVTSLAYLTVVRALGLEAAFFGGHSFGELSALHAAGAYSQKDFLLTARKRGELMAAAAQTPGAMTAVFADVEVVRALVARSGGEAVLANLNSRGQVVLAGTRADIEKVEALLIADGIDHRRLPVATAFHSPIVSSASEPFRNHLAEIAFQEPQGRVYSNVTAAAYASGTGTIRENLALQIQQPVRFYEQIEAMYADGARVFVEIGPGSVLTRLVDEILSDRPHLAVALDVKNQPGLTGLQNAAAQLSVAGVPLRLTETFWRDCAPPLDPAERQRPKLAVSINGSNYGKPYPPADGAQGRARPNPEPVAGTATAHQKSAPDGSTTMTDHQNNGHQTAGGPTAAPTHTNGATPVAYSHQAQPAAPYHTAPGAAYAAAYQTMPATYMSAFQEMQRQAAQAHAAYQQAMAESHRAFLQMAESAFYTMGAIASGHAPVPPAAGGQSANGRAQSQVSAAPPTFAPPQQMYAPPPQPQYAPAGPAPAFAPAFAAPQPAYAQTAPSAPAYAPPVGGSPAAQPAPVAQAVAPPAPAAPPAAATLTLEEIKQLLLEMVAEKTGYPVEMLDLDMELEAGLGIDSIKRVQILSAMKTKAPNLGEVDAKHLGSLRTLREIIEYLDRGSADGAAATGAQAGSAGEPTSGGSEAKKK